MNRILAIVSLVIVATLAGCGDGGSTSSSTGPSSGITISGFAFEVPTSVKAGAPITVTNADSVAHTFSDTGGAFDVEVGGGSTEQLTVASPGTYSVVCRIHASMKTTLTVT